MMKRIHKFAKGTLLLALALCLLTVFAAVAETVEFCPATGSGTVTDAEAEWEQRYIDVSREGVVDRIPVETVRVINFDTTIAMDPEYFTHSVRDGIDTFTYDAWQDEREVYYSVYLVEGSCPSDLCDELYNCYADSYACRNVTAVKVGSYDATAVLFDGENASPTYQRHFFLIPVDDGCIVIEAQFNFEMYEGLYRIMCALFDTLQIG
ncbi:MAG: hypothetical protein IKK08_05070 [Clostridia bacterium]|nr:hypothetical protein [Clostridia bacterium]